MKEKSLISVIIPVYNPGIHFKKCMESILKQTYTNLEIILVDDGSTDGSEQRCDEYAESDSRVTVIHQKNCGVSKARNTGLRIAVGDYYHFPDSDDYIEPDTYEYLLGIIENYHCDAVNFEHYITYPRKEIEHHYYDGFYGLFDSKESLFKLASGVQFCCNKLFSRKLITANTDLPVTFFNEDIARGEDTLFAATALQKADKVWFDKRALYHYVQSEESACRGHFRHDQLSVLKLYDAFKPIYGLYPEIWEAFIIYEQGILISIYYDLWADKGDTEIQTFFFKEIHKWFTALKNSVKLPLKLKIKYSLFDNFPSLFCFLHKLNLERRRKC